MKIKKLIFVIAILLLTGCTNKYTLVLSDNKIEESIDVVIPKINIPTDEEHGVEIDDEITPFINSDQYPLFNNYSVKYVKKIKENSDNYELNYKHTYKPEEFVNSNVLHTCFENYGYSYDKEYYLKITGRFYCAYSENTEINIKVKNRVLYSNADKKRGNTYTWYISDSNTDSVDIELRVARGFDLAFILPYVVAIVVIAFIAVFGTKFIKRRKESNRI